MCSELVKKAMCSTVTIIYDTEETPRFGSGFVIKRSGDESVIITCRHCVQGFKPTDTLRIRYIVDEDVRELPATVLFISKTDADVAFITVDGLSALPPFRFSELEMLIGQDTTTIGNCRPDNLWEEEDEWAIAKFPASCPGLVKNFRPNLSVLMKGVALDGMSGGPTLSSKGVSGMLTEGRRGFTIAITTEGIKAMLATFLTNRNIQFKEMDTIHQMLQIMPMR